MRVCDAVGRWPGEFSVCGGGVSLAVLLTSLFLAFASLLAIHPLVGNSRLIYRFFLGLMLTGLAGVSALTCFITGIV